MRIVCLPRAPQLHFFLFCHSCDNDHQKQCKLPHTKKNLDSYHLTFERENIAEGEKEENFFLFSESSSSKINLIIASDCVLFLVSFFTSNLARNGEVIRVNCVQSSGKSSQFTWTVAVNFNCHSPLQMARNRSYMNVCRKAITRKRFLITL